MPRQQRPTSRPAPKSKVVPQRPSNSVKVPKVTPQRLDFQLQGTKPDNSEEEVESDEELDYTSESDSPEDGGDDDDEATGLTFEDEIEQNEVEEMDLDGPRVAQWEPDELELEVTSSNDEEKSEEELAHSNSDHAGSSHLKMNSLQNDLSSLPLGALRKARYTLAQSHAVSDSEGDTSEELASEDEIGSQGGPSQKEKKEKPEWNLKRRDDLAKRANKHAPQEVTSKRPVTRRRTVVEVKTAQPRDPRFLPVAGEFSSDSFQKQYGFLADIHSSELKTLRENLKRAKKLLISSPRDLREERQEEVGRLELAVKRAESNVNKDQREMVEKKALSQIAKDERDKRKQGKGGWWMKEADKKELLVRARFDALAATGGKGAVKKAIEKKQKKINQKEKKSRPFSRERPIKNGEASTFSKRPYSSDSKGEGGRFEKRRKLG